MVYSIIVTLSFLPEKRACDFELPCQIPVRELEKILLNVINSGAMQFEGKYSSLSILCAGKKLDPSRSLAEANIWDGSALTVRMEG